MKRLYYRSEALQMVEGRGCFSAKRFSSTGNIPVELGNLTKLSLLHLPSNQLIGTIPSELGKLTDLVNLDLGYNELEGNIPLEITNLPNLAYLDLGSNQLTGGIPPELAKLTKLIYLELDSNYLSGNMPIELTTLPNLKGLNLAKNQLTGNIPTTIGSIKNLTSIHLNSNRLRGEIPASIINLTALGSWQPDIGYNMLTATDPTVISFLDTKDPDWAETQTIPPENLNTTDITGSSIKLTWTPIPYTGDGGYYRVYYAANPDGPYTEAGTTADKSASDYTVTGLSSDTTYYFVLETFTPAHDYWPAFQPNDLTTFASVEVSATTLEAAAVLGDLNGNGTTDLADAILVLKILTGVDTGDAVLDPAASVDPNTPIGLDDAIFILREEAGINSWIIIDDHTYPIADDDEPPTELGGEVYNNLNQ